MGMKLFFRPLGSRDITRDGGRANNVSVVVFNGRHGRGNTEPAAIFSNAFSFVSIKALSLISNVKKRWTFFGPFR
jgi:hypothetical protein